jgi:hypothetical protein
VVTAVSEFVFFDLAAKGVAVNAKQASGARLIASGMIHGAFNEAPFELGESLTEQNSAVNHLANESFQLILQNFLPPKTAARGPCCGQNR